MSYNKTKTDPELGQKIHEHLVKMGVETPTVDCRRSLGQTAASDDKGIRGHAEYSSKTILG